MDKMLGGYQALQIRLLNGRIFQKLLSKEPEAQYRSEQGKILTVLWQKEDGRATATDIALASGLANNTLTSMIKKLVDQGLVTIEQSDQDKRKKFVLLTKPRCFQKPIKHMRVKFKTLLKFPSRELEVFYRKRIRKIVYFWPIYYWRHFS